MTDTVTDLISEVQRLVGEASGPGVQIYSEDGWLDAFNRAFDMVFTKYGWPMFLEWATYTLDGSTGKFTTSPFINGTTPLVRGIEDILSVHRDGERKQLPRINRFINPSTLNGSTAMVFGYLSFRDTDFLGKKLIFYPLEATGDINVLARLHPGRLVQEDDILFDRTMMVHATAWAALTGEDLNPTAMQAQQVLFEQRFKDITAALARHPLYVTGDSGVPTDWIEMP